MTRVLWALPNFVTLLRLAAVPAAIFCILTGRLDWAFWVFFGAGLSDALDGVLARLLRAQTIFGSYLDPLADKLLLVSVYICLGVQESLPVWLVSLVLLRDGALLTGVGLSLWHAKAKPLHPLIISKINTGCQITLVAWILLAQGILPEAAQETAPLHLFTPVLIGIVAVTTVLSGFAYLVGRLQSARTF